MIVLGIETSCDDTSIALIKKNETDGMPPQVLAHQSFSQETILQEWGGVVPEIAARNHLLKLVPLLKETFKKANLKPNEVDLIGVTTHPGLMGPLLTGMNAAKSIALLNQKPMLPVNHLYAHLEAIFLHEEISYPYLGLLVSGGHSIYFLVHNHKHFEVLGSTIDDAAGEAFDKGGKLLGLGYPAGRIIDDLAKEGDSNKYSFPIGLKHDKNPMLSYSGVKTALRVFVDKNPQVKEDAQNYILKKAEASQLLKDTCASYQEAIISALLLKLKRAEEKVGKKLPLVVGGGVACNSGLRKKLQDNHHDVHFVPPRFCTDNGAMIANYALRHCEDATAFPECLSLDAKNRFLDKKKLNQERSI